MEKGAEMSVWAPELLTEMSLLQNARHTADLSLHSWLTHNYLRCENECLAKPKLPVPRKAY